MPDPQLPYEISGIVKDSRNRILIDLEISLKNITKTSNPLIVTTDSNGKYFADAGNFNTGYDSNDEVSVEAFTSFRDEYQKETFNIIGTKKTQNLNLEVVSSLQKGTTGYPVQNVLVNVNSKPFTKDNPIPVEKDERRYTIALAYNSDNLVEYQGWANVGSSKADSIWRIKKLIYSGTNVTDEQWAKGNDYFDKKWNDRESYSYS